MEKELSGLLSHSKGKRFPTHQEWFMALSLVHRVKIREMRLEDYGMSDIV